MPQTLSYEQAKQLILDRYAKMAESMGEVQRRSPIVMKLGRSWSIEEIMAEIQNDTAEGQRFIADEVRAIGYLMQ